MGIGLIIGALIGAYVLSKANLGSVAGILGTNNAPPPPIPANPTQTFATLGQEFTQTSQQVSTGLQVGSQVATEALNGLQAGSSALGAVPIVGTAAAAVSNILITASKKRAAEAVSENQAIDANLPNWDGAITQIINMYNSGQLTYAQVGQLLGTPLTEVNYGIPPGTLWNNFWNEVGPKVQSGRNGCKSGTVPHDPTDTTGTKFCGGPSGNDITTRLVTSGILGGGGGSYGAACCIAYEVYDNSMGQNNVPGRYSVFQALDLAQKNPGTPYLATILKVYPGKYSTYQRAAFTVSVESPILH